MDQPPFTNASSAADTNANSTLKSNTSGPPPWGNYKGPPIQPGSFPSAVEMIVYSYSSSIIFRRWAATVLDLLIFVGLFGTALFFDSIYLAYVTTGFILLYYLLLEGFTGYTAGKYILRIQVVREDGRPPGFVKSLIRTLLRIVETNPALFGALPAGICALVTKKRQRLGDMAANTYVVKVADLDFIKPSRRTKVTLAVIFSSLILFAVVPNVIALTTTGYPESKPKSVIHTSEDGRFQITDWDRLRRDSSSIAEIDANMALSNALKTKNIVVFTYTKEEMGTDITLEDFYSYMLEQRLDRTTEVIREGEAGVYGGMAYELTYRGEIDGDEYVYIATFVETSEHFHEIIAITDSEYYTRYGSELRATIATFREVAGEI